MMRPIAEGIYQPRNIIMSGDSEEDVVAAAHDLVDAVRLQITRNTTDGEARDITALAMSIEGVVVMAMRSAVALNKPELFTRACKMAAMLLEHIAERTDPQFMGLKGKE